MSGSNFIVNKSYLFVESICLIEDNKRTDKLLLGKFIKYEAVILWGDILPEGKAIFEYGTISCGHYEYVKEIL